MIEITSWMHAFLKALDATFGERIRFVGLQGSYGREEATEHSDIDLVVILDSLSPSDIASYNDMLDGLEHRELICGFLSGKEELLNWEPSDLFQFYFDTKPIRGSLDEILSLINEETVERAIKIGAGNVYHGCVHNMLYEKSDEILKGLYKSASFVIQAICFIETGKYASRMAELKTVVSPKEKEILETFSSLKQGGKPNFVPMSGALFEWAKETLNRKENR